MSEVPSDAPLNLDVGIELTVEYEMTYEEYCALLSKPVVGEVQGGRWDGLTVSFTPGLSAPPERPPSS